MNEMKLETLSADVLSNLEVIIIKTKNLQAICKRHNFNLLI